MERSSKPLTSTAGFVISERGSSTAAAAIGAFATIAAALIGGFFLLLANSSDSPAVPSLPTSSDEPGAFELPDLGVAETAVYLSLDNGPAGTVVNVSGEGFQPNERIVLRFHTEQIATTQSNDAGSFSNVAATIPGSFSKFAPQQFSIIASGQSSLRSADAPFTITG
jgi:hypothetical protein